MKHDLNTTEKRPYIRPEAELLFLRLQENIATSAPEQTVYYDDEFNGEDDVFS